MPSSWGVPAERRSPLNEVQDMSVTKEENEVMFERPASRTPSGSLHLRALYLLLERRDVLGKGLLLGAILGLVMAFALPSEYQSTVRLMPPDQSTSTLSAISSMAARQFGAVESFAIEGLGLNNTSGAVFVGILKSRTILERLSKRFHLTDVYGLPQDLAERKLSLNTDISEDRRSGIITIRVSDRDPARAAGIAQAYVEELQLLTVELATSSARRERQFIEERLAQVKKELDVAARELAEWSSSNRTYGIEQQKVMVESLATAQAQLIAAETELQGLQQIYSENNVRVRAARARVTEIRRQLGQLGGASLDNAAAGLPGLQRLPLLGVKYADYYRKVKVQELVYQTLTQRYEIAKVEEAKEIPTVQPLDNANVPLRRSGPPRAIITALGGLLGLFLTGVFILVQQRWVDIPASTPWKIFVQDARRVLQQARFVRKSKSDTSTSPLTLSPTTIDPSASFDNRAKGGRS